MKLTVKKSILAAEIAAVSPLAKARNTVPVLSYCKLAAGTGTNNGILAIHGTDLDCHYFSTVDAVTEESGQCLLPVAKARQVLELIRDDTITIEAESQRVIISSPTSGISRFSTDNVANFPQLPSGDKVSIGMLDWSQLKLVSWAAAQDIGRPAIEAVFIEPENGLIAVAADGRKVAKAQLTLVGDVKADWKGESIGINFVPLITSFGAAMLHDSEKHLHFEAPQRTLIVSKLTERYPNWRAMTNTNVIGSARVVRGEFHDCIALSHMHTKQGDDGARVVLERGEDGLRVGCGEEYSNIIDARFTGDFTKLGFFTNHLLPFLALSDDSPLKMQVTEIGHVHMNAGAVECWLCQART